MKPLLTEGLGQGSVGKLYKSQDRTGIWEQTAPGKFEITLYSHPNNLYAWDKHYHTDDMRKARRAAIAWARDGVVAGGTDAAGPGEA